MSKVHRRKKLEIMKDFVCNYGCGKAYGSYAALYTHIKNKHFNSNQPLPKIQGNLVRSKNTGRKGRPMKKQREQISKTETFTLQCKICQEQQCCCDSQISNSDVMRTIRIMQDATFVEFVNVVGQLQVSSLLSCVRDQEEQVEQLQCQRVREMYDQFAERCHKVYQISDIWVDYLSFSSRFWNSKTIKQLYLAVFTILSVQSDKIVKALQLLPQCSLMLSMALSNSKQWDDLVLFLESHR